MIAQNTPEFIKYLNSLESKNALILECPQCHNEFSRPKNVIQSKFGQHNNEKTIYCSHKCAGRAKITAQNVVCLQCEITFSKLLNQINKTPNHFCSKSCAAKYNNAHKTIGTRRSKLEVWLEDKLKTTFPKLEMDFNKKDAINSELDIYIPSLKLAFELNGIFHYEPIYGKNKLQSIQNNDNRKFQACLERGIEFVIIDTSKQTYFKESSALKYLDIIISIIDGAGNRDRTDDDFVGNETFYH